MTPDKKTTNTTKEKPPTKKALAAEQKALKLFDGMCNFIEHVTPGFMVTNIESINRVELSPAGKKHIAAAARKVSAKAADNKQIVLPREWAELLTYDKVVLQQD